MKKMKNVNMMLAGVAVGLIALMGCSKGAADSGYDIYLFNAKGENAAQVDAMAKAYQEAAGVRVKTFSIGAGAEQSAPMNTEMNSKNMPTIFSVQGINNLAMWLEGGYVQDFALVENNAAFSKLAADIAPDLRLTLGGTTNYGIPYNLEGYGYIVDTKMLAELFGSADVKAVIEDIKGATYDEWEGFVTEADKWINNAPAAAFTLNGKPYTLAAAKTALTGNLNGVIAFMGSQRWTYGDHLVNVALNAAFTTINDSLNATEADVRRIRGPLAAYAKALDFKTRHLAGKNGPAKRGQDLVSDANFGYDQAVQVFAEGKALFLKQGNWAYNNILTVSREVAERLYFLPVKMPITAADITAQGVSVEKMARSIPVFVPNYYTVNALCSEEEKQKAYDFLVWMNTSPEGQRFIIEDMAFIPYNADAAVTTVPNSLGNSILEYIKEGDTIGDRWHGAPSPWAGDGLGALLMEQYLIKPEWSPGDYETIADFGVNRWIELLNQ
ncbi:MAG: extracellular solute-binding protein [Spirochaetaceae bacterium]|jgi:raffinose/stachyose/melibiose transport system substrate-binding protein|nr:extracellular solute-binding protein [Spirochaetaceae bacterium]